MRNRPHAGMFHSISNFTWSNKIVLTFGVLHIDIRRILLCYEKRTVGICFQSLSARAHTNNFDWSHEIVLRLLFVFFTLTIGRSVYEKQEADTQTHAQKDTNKCISRWCPPKNSKKRILNSLIKYYEN
jgi:hypothetical protein